jgi:hypothetical protein
MYCGIGFLTANPFNPSAKITRDVQMHLPTGLNPNEKMLQIGIENTAYFCRNWNQILLRTWPMGINLVSWRDIFGSPKF